VSKQDGKMIMNGEQIGFRRKKTLYKWVRWLH